jgi:hypothetical protein
VTLSVLDFFRKRLILFRRDSGWGTWIRTKINGVRVRRSTVELFPNAIRRCLSIPLVRRINDFFGDASRKMRRKRHFSMAGSCLPLDATDRMRLLMKASYRGWLSRAR